MQKSMIRKGLVIGIMILFVGAGVISSTSGINEEIIVFTNCNSRGYIQDLIDNASNGDTIYIPSGSYYENIIIDKSIYLVGEDKETTIIDGSGSAFVLYISADRVNISGFTIRNGSSGFYFNNSSNNTIKNNNVNSNTEYGINLKNGSNNNLVLDCTISNNPFGIVIWNSSNNQLSNCYVCNGTLGITLLNSSNNIIANNIANNNTYIYEGPPPPPGPPSAGILFAQSTQNTVINNSFSNNNVGILFFNLYNQSKRKSYFNNSIDTSNLINGRPVYYFFNQENIFLGNLVTTHLSLAFCNKCIIENCNISNGDGIFLWSSNNNTIINTTSSNNYQGILVSSSELYRSVDNIISNCEVYYNSYNGIALNGGSSRNTVSKCNIYSNGLSVFGVGLNMDDSSNNNIINNTFTNDGLLLGGDNQQHFNENIEGNTVNGKPLYYYLNQQNLDIDGQTVGQIILINCTNFLINNTDISHTSIGIEIQFSSNISICNCNIYSNSWIAIGTGYYSKHMSISDCMVYNNSVGIGLGNSSNNSILNCNVYNNTWFGISLSRSSNNNLISNCKISNNFEIGLMLGDCYFNTIYHNNFIKNRENAYDDGDNTWDDGKYGNYWDDFKEKYPNANKKYCKGIWDTSYEIPGGDNKDNYPLIKQWPGSKPRTITKGNPYSLNFNLLSWFLERFPLLERLLSLIRVI